MTRAGGAQEAHHGAGDVVAGEDSPGPGAPISPRARHTCFEVADYGAMKATLEREGIKHIENTPTTV